MKSTSNAELRASARAKLRENSAYWNFVGGQLVLSIAVIALIVPTVLFLLAGGTWTIASAGGEALRQGAETLPELVDNVLSLGPKPLAMLAGISTVVTLAFTYIIGFATWGQNAMPIAAMRGGLRVAHAVSGFGHGWRMAWLILLQQTYIFLWMLLFFVPGVMAAFSYMLAQYIIIDHPDWSANRAITESKRLMKGNRWRFFTFIFCSFWWYPLLIMAAGFIPGGGAAVQLLLQPYVGTCTAAFYEKILDGDEKDTAGETAEDAAEVATEDAAEETAQ